MKLKGFLFSFLLLLTSCSTFFSSSPRTFRDYPLSGDTHVDVPESSFRIAPVVTWPFKPPKEETIDVSVGIVKPIIQIGDLPRKVRTTTVSSRGRWTIDYYLSSFDFSTTVRLKECPRNFRIVKQSLSPNDDMKTMPFEFMVVEVSGRVYHLFCCRDYSLKYDGAVENPSSVLFARGQRIQVASDEGQVLGELSEEEIQEVGYFAESLWRYSIFSNEETSGLRVVYDFVSSWLEAESAGEKISSRAGLEPWDYEKLTKELNLARFIYDVL